jgi:glycerol-3-phosphate dehydrogenase
MLEAADALLPGFSRSRALRVWSGARPLLPKTVAAAGAEDDRAVSRSHTVLRHRERDGVAGFVSIAGGKLTTFRLMAKDTVDAVCAELGVERPCTTAETPLPGSTGANYYRLPDHQKEFEQGRPDNPMICECELVSQADLLEAAERNPHVQIDDLRRVLRVGMGPCQGGFCAFRTAAILHGHGEYDRAEANAALRAFVQERWKGQRPVLWGQQLRQARLDAWIFQGVLDLEHVPS